MVLRLQWRFLVWSWLVCQSGVAEAKRSSPFGRPFPSFEEDIHKSSGVLPRVIGGSPASPGRHPFLVDLDDRFNNHYCMGSLIAPDLVLSAAHCNSDIHWARVGRYDKTQPIDESENFRVLQEIPHPLFNPRTFEFDFMVIQLDGSSSKQPVKLNQDSKVPPAGIKLDLAGFGDTDKSAYDEEFPDVLYQVQVRAMSNAICEQSEGPYYSYKDEITDDMLCARDEGKDSCQGDSGAPLLLSEGDGPEDDLQVGVVSWGLDCADPNYPGVYARVSTGYEWIRAVVCMESVNPPDSFDCPTASYPPVPSPKEIDNPVTFFYEFTSDDDSRVENGIWVEHVNGLNTEVINAVSTVPDNAEVFKRTVFLEEGELYALIIKDDGGNGVQDGGIELFMENAVGNPVRIASVTQEFRDYYCLLFYATLTPNVQVPHHYLRDRTYENDVPLTLEIGFDGFPEEIGVEIRFHNGTLFYYRPPRYYFQFVSQWMQEEISFPPERHDYVLTVRDIFGDGLGDGDTGYALGANGVELVRSDFTGGRGRSNQFTWPLEDQPEDPVPVILPATPAPTPRPTKRPTPSPTPRPTKRPTPSPTPRPTPGPTMPSNGIPPKIIVEESEESKSPNPFDFARGGLNRRKLRRPTRGS